jgi:hypothetical protein
VSNQSSRGQIMLELVKASIHPSVLVCCVAETKLFSIDKPRGPLCPRLSVRAGTQRARNVTMLHCIGLCVSGGEKGYNTLIGWLGDWL